VSLSLSGNTGVRLLIALAAVAIIIVSLIRNRRRATALI
jgi:hypothetical protein